VALLDRLPLAPTRRGGVLAASLAAAFVALAVLVEVGALNWLDQFSVDHLMPWLVPKSGKGLSPATFYRPFTLDTPAPNKLLDLWTYPCSVLVSLLVLLTCAYLVLRRAGPPPALALVAAWALGNAIEVLGKGVITRPGLHETVDGTPVHLVPFDNSFPSGHMIRGTVVAFAIAIVWPRATRWVALWAALVAPALVLQSAHTISDVVGGAVVGVLVCALAYPLAAPARA